MNAAGIDVSGRKSTVAVLRPFGEVIKLPFDVRHSAEELAALAKQLKSIEGETRVVMEHTGRYYEGIAKVLHEAGIYVSAGNQAENRCRKQPYRTPGTVFSRYPQAV